MLDERGRTIHQAQATWTAANLPPGLDTIKAIYSGDALFLGSCKTLMETVTITPTIV